VRGLAALVLALAGAPALAAEPPPGQAQSRRCVPCHGELGISTVPDAPNLAGQPRAYLVGQLKAYRQGKRTHEIMTVIAKPLTDADIEQLADWYSSIAVEAKRRP
jgi:cytochrome c553